MRYLIVVNYGSTRGLGVLSYKTLDDDAIRSKQWENVSQASLNRVRRLNGKSLIDLDAHNKKRFAFLKQIGRMS